MSPEYLAIVMFIALLVLCLLGFPMGFVMAGIGLIFGLVGWGTAVFTQIPMRIFMLMSNYVLGALPLFIFMGVMLERSGIADDLYSALHIILGPLRGGLGIATEVICTLFATATGVIGASITTIGLLALPSMLKRGYDKSMATGAVCAGGTLGILIPPSIMLVLYGPTAGVSVGRLFMAAFIPGLLLSFLYIAYIGIRCFFQPHLGPSLPAEERVIPLRKTLRLGVTSLLPVFFLILAVLGSIFLGLATPTEAAAMGALGSILITAGYRRFNWQTLKNAVYMTVRVTSMVLLVAMGAFIFIGVFTGLGGGKVVEAILLGLPLPPLGILAIMMFIVIIMGMFMDWVGIVLLIVPLFTPIGMALGFDPIWLALLICINLQIGFLSPPLAIAVFYTKGIAPEGVEIADIYRGVLPFIALQIVGLALCMLFPQIILWLPNLMIK